MAVGWFPRCSDARELERVAREHARALERNVDHHEAHATRLERLETSDRDQAQKLERLTVAVAEVRATLKAHVRIVLVVIPVAVTLLQQAWQWLAK